MPRKGISYEQVAKACTELEKFQCLSVRAIQAETGGSMTTVLKHYRRWQRESSGQKGVETVISDRLRHALLSELDETAVQSRQAVQQELKEAQQRIENTRKEADSKHRRLIQQVQQARRQQTLLEYKKNDAEQRASVAESQLRSAHALLSNRMKSIQEEPRKPRPHETALQQIQDLKRTLENKPLEQEPHARPVEEPLQDSPQQKK